MSLQMSCHNTTNVVSIFIVALLHSEEHSVSWDTAERRPYSCSCSAFSTGVHSAQRAM